MSTGLQCLEGRVNVWEIGKWSRPQAWDYKGDCLKQDWGLCGKSNQIEWGTG